MAGIVAKRNDEPPRRPEPVQYLLKLLIALETETRFLTARWKEWRGRLELNGPPRIWRPPPPDWMPTGLTDAMTGEPAGETTYDGYTYFPWYDLPRETDDPNEQLELTKARTNAAKEISATWAVFTQLRDTIFWSVRRWRALIDTARDAIPGASLWTDDQRAPAIDRWSAHLRAELAELGGIIHRLMDGDLPPPDADLVPRLMNVLAKIAPRVDELKRIGPEAIHDDRASTPAPAVRFEPAQSVKPTRTPRAPRDLISHESAAELAACSADTIRRRIKDGTLTGWGRTRLVSEAQVRRKKLQIRQRAPRTKRGNKA